MDFEFKQELKNFFKNHIYPNHIYPNSSFEDYPPLRGFSEYDIIGIIKKVDYFELLFCKNESQEVFDFLVDCYFEIHELDFKDEEQITNSLLYWMHGLITHRSHELLNDEYNVFAVRKLLLRILDRVNEAEKLFLHKLDWSKPVETTIQMMFNYKRISNTIRYSDPILTSSLGYFSDLEFCEIINSLKEDRIIKVKQAIKSLDSDIKELSEMDYFYLFLITHSFNEFEKEYTKSLPSLEKERIWIGNFEQIHKSPKIPILQGDEVEVINVDNYSKYLNQRILIDPFIVKNLSGISYIETDLNRKKGDEKVDFSENDISFFLKFFDPDEKGKNIPKLDFVWHDLKQIDFIRMVVKWEKNIKLEKNQKSRFCREIPLLLNYKISENTLRDHLKTAKS